jgi:hypothetical protein
MRDYISEIRQQVKTMLTDIEALHHTLQLDIEYLKHKKIETSEKVLASHCLALNTATLWRSVKNHTNHLVRAYRHRHQKNTASDETTKLLNHATVLHPSTKTAFESTYAVLELFFHEGFDKLTISELEKEMTILHSRITNIEEEYNEDKPFYTDTQLSQLIPELITKLKVRIDAMQARHQLYTSSSKISMLTINQNVGASSIDVVIRIDNASYYFSFEKYKTHIRPELTKILGRSFTMQSPLSESKRRCIEEALENHHEKLLTSTEGESCQSIIPKY